MSRDSVLARGRAFAATGMTDECEITRVVSTQTNPLSGEVTEQRAVIYSGPCRFQQAMAPWAGPATVGQAAIRLSALELQLPVAGSEGIAADDRAEITACQHDAELVGLTFIIGSTHHASHKTTRRLPLQEVLP